MIHATAIVARDAKLGAGVKIGPCAVIEEDVTLGDGCEIAALAVIKRHTRMGARNRVAEHAVIGGLTKLVQDALPFCVTDGNPGRARGLNLTGLRRGGFSREEIAALKEAYRMLHARVPLAEALTRMKAMGSAAVGELAGFIASSKRGFAHPG